MAEPQVPKYLAVKRDFATAMRSGNNFWLLSLNNRNSNGNANESNLNSNGNLNNNNVNNTNGVRPPISRTKTWAGVGALVAAHSIVWCDGPLLVVDN